MGRERFTHSLQATVLLAAVIALLVAAAGFASAITISGDIASKVDPALLSKLDAMAPGEKVVVWVRFVDRPFANDHAAVAQWRAEHHNLPPVDEGYIHAVASMPGVGHRVVDELTNQISVEMPAQAIQGIAHMPFIESIEEVDLGEPSWTIGNHSCTGDHKWTYWNGSQNVTRSLEKPMQTINISGLHNAANHYNGTGIKIGVVDSGIQRTHECFNVNTSAGNGNPKVANEKDFTGGAGDNDDGNANTADDEIGHGTAVAGVAAGYSSSNNRYIGTAPDAKLAIAKMSYLKGGAEYWYSDSYVDAIKWLVNTADVDIITSSVNWGSPTPDGTHVTTRWVDWAVKEGVVVCTSMGNLLKTSGDNRCPDTAPAEGSLKAPADNFNGISVGAIKNDASAIACYSRKGRTTDNRFKPDVVAPGGSGDGGAFNDTNWISAPCLHSTGTDWYAWWYGTSFATPMVAGVIACMMEKDNSLKGEPLKVRTRLWETAVDKGDDGPDTTYGYGLIDANAAAENAKPQLLLRDSETGVDGALVTDNGYLPSCDSGGNGSFSNERSVNVAYPVPNGVYEGVPTDDPFWCSPSIFVDNDLNSQPDNPDQPKSGQNNTFKVRVRNIGDGNAVANQICVKLYKTDPNTGMVSWDLLDTQFAGADIPAGSTGLVALTWTNTPQWNNLGQAHWCIGATVEYQASADDKAPTPGVSPIKAYPFWDVVKCDNFTIRNFFVQKHLSPVNIKFRVQNTTNVPGPVILLVEPKELPSGWSAYLTQSTYPPLNPGQEAYPEPELIITQGSTIPGQRAIVRVQAVGPNGQIMGGISVNTYNAGVGDPGNLTLAVGPASPGNHMWSYNPVDPNNEMLQLSLVATVEPARIRSISLAASGSGDDVVDIASVKLWADNNGDGVVQDPGDTLLAAGAYWSDDGGVELSPAAPYIVNPGPPVKLIISYTMSGSGNNGDTYKFTVVDVDATGQNSGANTGILGLPVQSCVKTKAPTCTGALAANVGAYSPGNHWGFAGDSSVMLQMHVGADCCEDVNLTSVLLQASGSGDDLDDLTSVSIYQDNDGDGALDGSDTLLGSGIYSGDEGVASIGVSATVPKCGGIDLLVVYTLGGGAGGGITFSCSVTGIGAIGVSSGNPIPVAGLSLNGPTMTVGYKISCICCGLGRWQQERDGTLVDVDNVIVSAGAHVFAGNKIYVQEIGRSHGIMVNFGDNGVYVNEGDVVDLDGVIVTDPTTHERMIVQPTLSFVRSDDQPTPLAMANKSAAGSDFGSYKSGATGLFGLNNVGLLGKVFGRVVGGGADYFVINDGSGPIRVYTSGALNPLSSPPPASYAAVTGLISIVEETPGGNLIRALRPRWNSDIWYAVP